MLGVFFFSKIIAVCCTKYIGPWKFHFHSRDKKSYILVVAPSHVRLVLRILSRTHTSRYSLPMLRAFSPWRLTKTSGSTRHTVFENHPKCRIWIFEFWHFPPIFDLLKLTCLVALFDASFRFSKTRQNESFLTFLINFCPLKI